MKKQNKQWYRIGEVARKLDIAVETIRMYEREGILLIEKTATGQRIFTNEDLNWLRCIRKLIKEERLNIEGIRRLLAMMPCWKIRPCSIEERSECPAFNGAMQPCWTMKEKIPLTCRAQNCRECSVYQTAAHCENIKEIVYNAYRVTDSRREG
ncbi:MAG: MerR family transcriptional regulator [Calditrichaeota bacterium]|nr:MAG: MerR family transcriptional regulator [Calditrichota bacterium]